MLDHCCLHVRLRGRAFALWTALVVSFVSATGAQASDPIDLLVVYTPRALSEHFSGNKADLEQAIIDEVAIMNQGLVNSFLPADFQYELVGMEEVCFLERENIRLDLQWVHASPEVAALRNASGADFVLMITGTSNYGGMARAIFSSSPTRRTDAFAVVEAFGLDTLTVGHELGHVLGCAHNPEVLILPDNPGSNYGFLHWEEEPFFRTLMAYYYFPGENCQECKENQLNAFSSPLLWYMFDGAGNTLNQTCWPTDLGNGSYELACPNGTTVELSDVDLAAQGLPIGNSLSDNRDQVLGRWDIAAAYFDPPLDVGCSEDCGALDRVGCTQAGQSCGDCLPGFAAAAGTCHPVVPAQPAVPLIDGCFTDAGAIASDDGEATPFTVDLGAVHELARIDLHFSTYDETGAPDWGWTPNSFMPWNPPAPPDYDYEVEVSLDGQTFTSLATGTSDTPVGSTFGDDNGHTMMRLAWAAADADAIEAARWVRVQLSGCAGADCSPQVGLHEVQAFGAASIVPELISTKVMRLLDNPENPGNDNKRRVSFVSKGVAGEEGAVSAPAWESAQDPTSGGAQLQFYRVGGLPTQIATHSLPASGWKRIGNDSKPGFRYKDGSQEHGPIKKIILKDGLLKIIGRGAGLYSLADAPQGEMAVRLSFGEEKVICAAAPAREPVDRLDTTSRFHAVKNTPAPASCPDLP